MGQNINVTSFERMEKAAKDLKQYSIEYTEIYKNLLKEGERSKEAWDGADNVEFVTRIQGIAKHLEDMAKKLDTAGDALQIQHDNYYNTQQNNINQAKKLAN